MVVAMCFMNRIYKKCKTKRKLTLMKIYLFAHGRCGTPQANEHKILCNNLEKCEKMLRDVMKQHLQQFGKM